MNLVLFTYSFLCLFMKEKSRKIFISCVWLKRLSIYSSVASRMTAFETSRVNLEWLSTSFAGGTGREGEQISSIVRTRSESLKPGCCWLKSLGNDADLWSVFASLNCPLKKKESPQKWVNFPSFTISLPFTEKTPTLLSHRYISRFVFCGSFFGALHVINAIFCEDFKTKGSDKFRRGVEFRLDTTIEGIWWHFVNKMFVVQRSRNLPYWNTKQYWSTLWNNLLWFLSLYVSWKDMGRFF